MRAHQIPVAHTPEGGWRGEMPPPILAHCTEPVADGAPNLRGTWRAVRVEQAGKRLDDHPLNNHVERIEQCGDRVVITASRVIHDMRADGTLENGVNDVMEMDLKTRISVAAVFDHGRLDLYPGGYDPSKKPLVTREIVGGELVWNYAVFTVTMRRIDTVEESK